MPERALLITSSGLKLQVAAAGTTAPPTAAGDGVDLTAWKPFAPRRAAIKLKASVALNATAISVWAYFDGEWSKIGTLADAAFVTGDLSRTYVFDYPIGDRLALAYTASTGTIGVTMYPIEVSIA